MQKIYTIVSFENLDLKKKSFRKSRAVGFFNIDYGLDKIKEHILNNACDISESGTCPYILIEEVHQGFYPKTRAITWFEWSKESEVYKEISSIPKDLTNTLNFSIG